MPMNLDPQHPILIEAERQLSEHFAQANEFSLICLCSRTAPNSRKRSGRHWGTYHSERPGVTRIGLGRRSP